MKMNWNWGSKLMVAMLLFMLLIITLVYMSMRQTYDLVEKDYYPKALEYQEMIDKTRNSNSLEEKVEIENLGEQLILTFQPAFRPFEIQGTIIFYRPSNEGLDFSIPIRPDSTGRQLCDIRNLQKGKYIVKLDYEVEGKGYYQEESIYREMK